MTKPQPPFDSEAYLNYKKLLEEKQSNNFVEDVTKVGFRIDQALAKIIDQLDMIIEQLEEEEDE
tara:strand:- start:313 stop:504 length:192 start_codon:yes stop_codon:yes gene_type:complete